MEKGYWFRSELFDIIEGEDEETNPGIYGRTLALWLCDKLGEAGYKTRLVPEDWGWCAICSDGGYMLWIGCGSTINTELLPNARDVVWHVFPQVGVPITNFRMMLRRFLGTLDLRTPLVKLDNELETILRSESGIELCDQPSNGITIKSTGRRKS